MILNHTSEFKLPEIEKAKKRLTKTLIDMKKEITKRQKKKTILRQKRIKRDII